MKVIRSHKTAMTRQISVSVNTELRRIVLEVRDKVGTNEWDGDKILRVREVSMTAQAKSGRAEEDRGDTRRTKLRRGNRDIRDMLAPNVSMEEEKEDTPPGLTMYNQSLASRPSEEQTHLFVCLFTSQTSSSDQTSLFSCSDFDTILDHLAVTMEG